MLVPPESMVVTNLDNNEGFRQAVVDDLKDIRAEARSIGLLSAVIALVLASMMLWNISLSNKIRVLEQQASQAK